MNANTAPLPLEWIANPRASRDESCRALDRLMPPDNTRNARH